MSVKIDGLKDVLSSFDDLGDTKKLEAVLTQACLLVERSAKQNAPKDTGALRRSITSEIRNNGSDLVGVVFTPLEYAPYIEYGTGLFAEEGGRQDAWWYLDDEGNWHSTSGMKPQPYLRPALNENREKILRMFKEGINND